MSKLIEFVGAWSDEERSLLTRMMEKVEETLHLPPSCETARAPWICRLDEATGERLIVVSRAYLSGTCVASSIRQLGDELTRLATQPQPVSVSRFR